MKVTVNITITTDDNQKTSSTEQIDRDQINARHVELSKQHSECFVNFSYDEGQNFICGARWGQMQDEIKMENKEMTWDEFRAKWYPGIPA